MNKSSKFCSFYSLSPEDRLARLQERGWLQHRSCSDMARGSNKLSVEVASHMIENCLGTFSLPYGVAVNLSVNGEDRLVPMVVEEPSIVAALSGTAKLVRKHGKLTSHQAKASLYGQVQLIQVKNVEEVVARISKAKDQIIDYGNSLGPRMSARGGGVKGLRIRSFPYAEMVVVDLEIDTCDAMGANFVNSVAEGVGTYLEERGYGRVLLRILSNLADQALVTSTVSIPREHVAGKRGPEDMAERIAAASCLAEIDPYRAATHNKGIFNGIDAVAIATGNDWRAIEAGAHAYAALEGGYRPLATWRVVDKHLTGELKCPLKVGVIGAQMRVHPKVRVSQELLGFPDSRCLAEIMGAVGLLQNLAALRALCGEGINKGHLKLHERCKQISEGALCHVE